MTFSAVDDSLSPPDHHTISLWAQYVPYEQDPGAETAAETVLAAVAPFAPNIREIILDKLIETPAYIERELGLIRGDLQHLALSPGQMFMLRPGWSLSQYRTPIEQLFLTGSSTHPGGGIMGVSGYNTAQVMLADR